jgi:phosphatidylglycerophosphate synthase
MTVDAYPGRSRTGTADWELLGALLAQICLILTVGWLDGGMSWAGWLVGFGSATLTDLALHRAKLAFARPRLSQADWVTLTRASLAAGVAGLVAASLAGPIRVELLVTLAVTALVLDAVDGPIARRAPALGRLGAVFDGEVDAFLILALSVYVARLDGAWILAIGAMRYVSLAAWLSIPWLRGQLPTRYWRKVVAAIQGVTLTLAAAAILPGAWMRLTLLGALILLSESFGRDIWWLRRARPAVEDRLAAVPAGPPRSPLRRSLGIVATVLAVGIVWIALVAPYQPRDLHLVDFIRIPLELIIVAGLASLLPTAPRRVFAVLVGVLLAVLLMLKVISYETYTNFDRPFDPIGDLTQFNNALYTLRATIGRSETRWLVKGTEIGIAVAVLLMVVSMLRLTWAAAQNPRQVRRGLTALSVVWVLSWLLGAGFAARTPVASSLTAGLAVDQARAVIGDVRDRSVFAAQIEHDPLSGTPSSRLLTALRGKDVLLVFDEAYGQVAVTGSSFSAPVDTALRRGDRTLAGSGFSSRSGYLSSPTFGGISWLAHSTLESGLWVNTQDRYNQLLSARRLTLASAFRQAGWRTVDDVPSDNRPWPQGKRFYGFDAIYDRYQVGYRGPSYTYASMPDQYTYAALDRLELAKTHRKPLFAEVDTVSSHEPWTRVPEEIPWNAVGDGSIYNRLPVITATRGDQREEQAGYAASIAYSLTALTSFIKHADDPNLVTIVLGDHQPQPIVSGLQPNHEVPISIISRDPEVLKRVAGWGWSRGLKPASDVPVWPMSAFRNRFLTTFDAPAPSA